MAAKAEEEQVKKQIADLRNDIRGQALEIIARRMPKKILALDTLLKSDPRLQVPLAEVERIFREDWAARKPVPAAPALAPAASDETPKQKKRKMDEPAPTATATTTTATTTAAEVTVPSNRAVKEAMEMLRIELVELIEMLNSVKMWIQLSIPRIEDGNNFGVNVQEETVGELSRAEEAAFTGFENMTKYFITRGKLVTKCLKWPALPDYITSVAELDQKEFINCRLTLLDVRNNYAILYDMIVKNIERLKNPRGTDHTDRIF